MIDRPHSLPLNYYNFWNETQASVVLRHPKSIQGTENFKNNSLAKASTVDHSKICKCFFGLRIILRKCKHRRSFENRLEVTFHLGTFIFIFLKISICRSDSSLYQEVLANPQSQETSIEGQGNPGICITTLGSLTGFFLVTSHNQAPFLSTTNIFLLSLTTDGIEGGGLGHSGESYSTFLGLPIYM